MTLLLGSLRDAVASHVREKSRVLAASAESWNYRSGESLEMIMSRHLRDHTDICRRNAASSVATNMLRDRKNMPPVMSALAENIVLASPSNQSNRFVDG